MAGKNNQASKRDPHLKQARKLSPPLTRLKGVGPKRAMMLAQKGLRTILDLFYFTPIRYEDRTRFLPITEAQEGVPALVKGRVISGGEERFYRSRKKLFRIAIRDAGAGLELLWFQYRKPHLVRFVAPGTELLAFGAITTNRGKRQMVHPEIVQSDSRGDQDMLGFQPVYSTITGVSPRILRSVIKAALEEYLPCVVDPVPEDITHRMGLPDLSSSIRGVHFPSEDLSIDRLNQFETPFHRRLVFDRFFLVMLTLAFRKKVRERLPAPVFSVPSGLKEDLARFFPFQLTCDQMKAIENLIEDFTSGKPMNRLLLGDVGCGKTVVSAVAAHMSIHNKTQVALMVPTQVLARQHM